MMGEFPNGNPLCTALINTNSTIQIPYYFKESESGITKYSFPGLLWKKEGQWCLFLCFLWCLGCSQDRKRGKQSLRYAMIIASKCALVSHWVISGSREHAPTAMTLANLSQKGKEKFVFYSGAGRRNNHCLRRIRSCGVNKN